MRLLVLVLATYTLLLTSALPVAALYDPRTQPNNKVGVHILDPNEISTVPEFTNSNGGDWGYVTVPIQPSDRDQTKWQTFMRVAQDKHLIPIIRITTIPLGGTWDLARDTDLVDFANFLGELDWPVENRYIVLFNEVNRDQEWGGTVDPAAYARIVKNAYTIFKERSSDFYLLGPALDSALPNSATSMSASSYLTGMQREDPLVFTYFDGWASHSYPNPAFSASPTKTGWQSIVSYKTELSSLKLASKPVFITETGWDQKKLSAQTVNSYWLQAFTKWNADPNVVAVTPFVLQGGSQFEQFSLLSSSGEVNPSGQALKSLPKTPGNPPLSKEGGKSSVVSNLTHTTSGENRLNFLPTSLTLEIENFFRGLFGMTTKKYLTVGETKLTVEVADTTREWEKGLSGRDSLPSGTGLLFIFPRPHLPIFWMKEMKFPLDIIWITDGKIVAVAANTPVVASGELPTYSPPVPVDYVLEVPAGYAASQSWAAGTEVTIND